MPTFAMFEVVVDSPTGVAPSVLEQGIAALVANGMAGAGRVQDCHVQMHAFDSTRNIAQPDIEGYGIATFRVVMVRPSSMTVQECEHDLAQRLVRQLHYMGDHPANIAITLMDETRINVEELTTKTQPTSIMELKASKTPLSTQATALPPQGLNQNMSMM